MWDSGFNWCSACQWVRGIWIFAWILSGSGLLDGSGVIEIKEGVADLQEKWWWGKMTKLSLNVTCGWYKSGTNKRVYPNIFPFFIITSLWHGQLLSLSTT